MDDFMKQALEIAKAQAGVRPMTAEEFFAYTKDIAEGLLGISVGKELSSYVEDNPHPVVDTREAMTSIKDNSITCLVCGKKGKVLRKGHLASHGMTPKEYREKFGIKKGTPLMCKTLVRARRETMNSMRLWERKTSVNAE